VQFSTLLIRFKVSSVLPLIALAPPIELIVSIRVVYRSMADQSNAPFHLRNLHSLDVSFSADHPLDLRWKFEDLH
jgi:hypothetical protein